VVMWWICVAWTIFTAVAVYMILTEKELTAAKNLSLAIILPAVATATTAAEGGLVTLYAHDLSARLAIPIIIVSYLMLGIGFFIAILIYALFLQRILVTGTLDGVKRPSLCLLLGPTGQTATALLGLAASSKMYFAAYDKGTFFQESAAMALHGASVLFALLVFGLGVFWMTYAVYGILEATFKKEVKWTPAWYSTIFPTGTMNSAMIFFSQEMDSPTWRVLATGLLFILIISALANLAFTIRGVARGQVLVVRDDPRQKKES
jgi:tellurite resistance protein TehA-like permease